MFTHSLESLTFSVFLQEFLRVFNYPLQQSNAVKLILQQDRRSVSEHALEFWIIAARTSWDEMALKGTFLHAFPDRIKDQLADEPKSLGELIHISSCIDQRFLQRSREVNYKSHSSYTSGFCPFPQHQTAYAPMCEPEPEPMQIGQTCLSPEERQRRILSKCCIYCGKQGHVIANCPLREALSPIKQELQVGTSSMSLASRLILPTVILINQQRSTVSA